VAPRRYTQRKRADSADATRARVVAAAMDLYRERGVAATTLAAIAERADVARGTVVHHFGGADGVLDAVAEQVLVNLEMPDERILEGIETDARRARAFITAMVRFFERSAAWWPVFESVMQRPGLQAREADYWAGLGQLQAAALGPELAADQVAMTAIGALIHPGTLGSFLWVLETSGIEADERAEIVVDLALAYLQRRRDRQVAA
jgi:AcrR family transcriptional regulator